MPTPFTALLARWGARDRRYALSRRRPSVAGIETARLYRAAEARAELAGGEARRALAVLDKWEPPAGPR